MIPLQEDRPALLAKALRYRPVRNPVDGEDLAVIRFALERGVETHGAGGCVRGIYNDVTLHNAGAVMARYLPRVREPTATGKATCARLMPTLSITFAPETTTAAIRQR